jgi:hypothetical protein
MKLVEACEPLFQYVCDCSRAFRSGASVSYAEARSRVEQLLDEVRVRVQADAESAILFDRPTEESLVFFLDEFFSDANHQPLSDEWSASRLAYHLVPPNYTGSETFWLNLDAALADRSEAGKHRVALYYEMVGLGMTGIHRDNPDLLRRKMIEMQQRIFRGVSDTNLNTRLSDDHLKHVNRDDLIEPPVKPPVVIGIAAALLSLVVIVAYVAGWRDAVGGLRTDLATIEKAYTTGTTEAGK